MLSRLSPVTILFSFSISSIKGSCHPLFLFSQKMPILLASGERKDARVEVCYLISVVCHPSCSSSDNLVKGNLRLSLPTHGVSVTSRGLAPPWMKHSNGLLSVQFPRLRSDSKRVNRGQGAVNQQKKECGGFWRHARFMISSNITTSRINKRWSKRVCTVCAWAGCWTVNPRLLYLWEGMEGKFRLAGS